MRYKKFETEMVCRVPLSLRHEVLQLAEKRQVSQGEAMRILLYAGLDLLQAAEEIRCSEEIMTEGHA